ncbi:hypothetical protein B0H63DRAFT_559820 [Podospora didyma]|uniref:Uncharacterized protein n=1 Tax=Podospora didyma TaxID=330526 RepID=A0AAE0NPA0_9PEZI|nr:hypothetical protein B0H63DRAFT_559820 [Podospora didyma]
MPPAPKCPSILVAVIAVLPAKRRLLPPSVAIAPSPSLPVTSMVLTVRSSFPAVSLSALTAMGSAFKSQMELLKSPEAQAFAELSRAQAKLMRLRRQQEALQEKFEKVLVNETLAIAELDEEEAVAASSSAPGARCSGVLHP